MKVSDYIVSYLSKLGVRHIFGYPGGMVTHLMDSIYKSSDVVGHIPSHEQGAGFAACGYARMNNTIGVVYATSGPGATNLITPLCHAYFEAIPVLFITGQVNRNESKKSLGVRQRGFQETDIIKLVESVTKYAAYVENPEDIKFHLDYACYIATNGRAGSVLLDIPMDVLRADIEIETLKGYTPNTECDDESFSVFSEKLSSCLRNAKRPVLLVGNGVNSSNTKNVLVTFSEKLQIPIVSSMIAVDLFPKDNECYYGFIGAYGQRCANFIISRCDMILSLGSRLDGRQTGALLDMFAPDATLVRVDVDKYELENKIKEDEVQIHTDIRDFLPWLAENFVWEKGPIDEWKSYCDFLREELKYIDNSKPQAIIEAISRILPSEAVITTDVGQNQVWVAQSFQVKKNQSILFSGGHGSMGVSIPSAIGAFYATSRPVYAFCGDGGLQMTIQELQWIIRENLPIKILLLNNNALGMIRHFQELYFEECYAYTVPDGGYSAPNFLHIAQAYGFRTISIDSISQVEECKEQLWDEYPLLIEIKINGDTYSCPKLEFQQPLYNQDPKLNDSHIDRLLNWRG